MMRSTEAVQYGNRLNDVLTLEDPLRPEVLRQDAQVLGDTLGQWAASAQKWQDLLAFIPDDDEAFDALSAYFTAAGKQRELAALLARRVALRHDVPLELLISLGRARSVVPGMEEAALMTLLQAQSASPDNPEVFALIIDLMARQNDWASVLAAHEGWLSYKGASASLSRVPRCCGDRHRPSRRITALRFDSCCRLLN